MAGQALKIGLSLALIVGSGSYLLYDTMANEETLEFYHPADVVIVKGAELRGQRIRMGGHVEPGSIIQQTGTLNYRFKVQPVEGEMKFPEAEGKTVTVNYTGVVPDTFKDDAQVIVSGSVQGDNSFLAKDLVAKCPSKYEAEEKNAGQY